MLETVPSAGGTHPPDFHRKLALSDANPNAEAMKLAHPSFIDTEESLAEASSTREQSLRRPHVEHNTESAAWR